MPIPAPRACPAMFADAVAHRPIDPTARGRGGAPVRTPGAGVAYPAIVSPGTTDRADLNGTVEAVGSWRVMVLSVADPAIRVDDSVEWTPNGSTIARTLVAASDSRPVGGGAWQVACDEAGPGG